MRKPEDIGIAGGDGLEAEDHMPKGDILWLGREPGQIESFAVPLREQGLKIDITRSLSNAERLLREKIYKLLIFGIRIPTLSAEEEKAYPPAETQGSMESGVTFLKRNIDQVRNGKIKVLALGQDSLELDAEVKAKLVALGLQSNEMDTLFALCHAADFQRRIHALLPHTSYRSNPSGS